MKLIPITHLGILIAALTEDKLYKDIIGIDDLQYWIPDMVATKWYLIQEGKEYVGIFIVRQITSVLYEFHGGVYKPYRGNGTRYCKFCLDELKKTYPGKYITTISKNNEAVRKLLEKLNFNHFATVKNGYADSDMHMYEEKE